MYNCLYDNSLMGEVAMNFRKMLSVAVAGAVALSAAAITASAETIGSASIYVADETWSSQVYWGGGLDGENTIGIASVTPAEITGDGIYTTAVEFKEKMNYGHVFCLSSDIAATGSGADSRFAEFPDAEMSIVSVKADGNDIQGNTSVSDVNDSGFMKINILNPLVDASENFAYKSDWTSGIKSIEVTFEIKGTGIVKENIASGGEDGAETPGSDNEQGSAEKDDDAATGSVTDIPQDDNTQQGNVLPGDATTVPDTGNAPLSPMAAVTALAGVIAFMSRKKD